MDQLELGSLVLTASHTVYAQAANPDLYLDELVFWLAFRYDIAISVPALQQHLIEAGLIREIFFKIALERDEVLVQQWRDALAGDDFLRWISIYMRR